MADPTDLTKYTDISLDFARSANTPIVYAHQHDVGSRFVRVTPLWHGCKMDISDDIDVTASWVDELNKGDIVNCSIFSGRILLELTSQMLAQAGQLKFDVLLQKREKRLSSQYFLVHVAPDFINDDTQVPDQPGTTIYDAIVRVKEATQNAETETEAAQQATAAANASAKAASDAAAAATEAKQETVLATQAANDAAQFARETAEALMILDVFDCGYFSDVSPVIVHNYNMSAHTAMIIDGNVGAAAGESTDEELHAHEIDPDAHPNLHIDGNIIY